jgi:hypothetical protein
MNCGGFLYRLIYITMGTAVLSITQGHIRGNSQLIYVAPLNGQFTQL